MFRLAKIVSRRSHASSVKSQCFVSSSASGLHRRWTKLVLFVKAGASSELFRIYFNTMSDEDSSTNMIIEPDWSGILHLLNEGSEKMPQKKKKEKASFEQRELLLNFICENPELVTHSSTRASEKALWEDLTDKLNSLKPEKSLISWRMLWTNWMASLKEKPEAALTMIDYKLKKFLSHIECGTENSREKKIVKKKLSLEEITDRLYNIESEKKELKLEIDELDYRIIKCKNALKEMKAEATEKRKREKVLCSMKNCLHQKRRKLMEQVDSDSK